MKKDKCSVKVYIFRLLVVIIGSTIIGTGISLFLQAGKGSDPWTVFFAGVTKLFNENIGYFYGYELTVGRTNQLMGVAIVLFVWLVEKRKPNIGTILNFLIVGFSIDFCMAYFKDTVNTLGGNSLLVIGGTVMMGIGTGVYVSADIGEGPIELMMMLLVNRLKKNVRLVKIVMDGVVAFLGYILGGPLGWATVLSVLGIGPVVQWAMKKMNQFIWKEKQADI